MVSVVAPSAFSEGLEHPKQWQFQESLEVPPGPILRDRCIRAVYLSEALKKEHHVRNWEQWHPPISDNTAQWLEWYSGQGSLVLVFCEQSKV